MAQVFREEVNNNGLFKHDQINTSKKLVNYFGERQIYFICFHLDI
jgi:hypothetical protein